MRRGSFACKEHFTKFDDQLEIDLLYEKVRRNTSPMKYSGSSLKSFACERWHRKGYNRIKRSVSM